MKARVKRLTLPEGRRVIAVSDIHGNIDCFRGLLEKVGFGAGDMLMILGDFLEKGPESLKTLRYIMELSNSFDVHALCGNCDGWHEEIYGDDRVMDMAVREYLVRKPQAFVSQMCREAGFEVSRRMPMDEMKRVIAAGFASELEFLHALPTIIDTEEYTFVHAGIPEGELDELDAYACMRFDNFLNSDRSFEKWCVVGHWPVALYGDNVVCANPVIDREKRIISIDGGCSVKSDGQLNAFIIPPGGGEFSYDYYDGLPRARVMTPQSRSETSAYIRFSDPGLRVVERGGEFSLCEYAPDGRRMEVLTKYLKKHGRSYHEDCTDYEPELRPGDMVSVIEVTSRGYFIKHDGVSGWYRGELRFE